MLAMASQSAVKSPLGLLVLSVCFRRLFAGSLPSEVESPLGLLDHVNLNVPEWTDELQHFWFDVLECSRDPRDHGVFDMVERSGGTMQGLVWVNVGLQQLHLPVGEPENGLQKLPGALGLVFPELSTLRQRLEQNGVAVWHHVSENSAVIARFGPAIEFRSPVNNVLIRAHEVQRRFSFPEVLAAGVSLAGPQSMGSGMAYVELQCAPGCASGICRFYQGILGVPAVSTSGTCFVPIGDQALVFQETSESLPDYDGHHVAVYVGDISNGDLSQSFSEMYLRAHQAGLVYNNPRFPQLRYDTLAEAQRHAEFRVLDIVDPDTGKTVHQLEHEIRSLKHFTFHGKDLVEERTFEAAQSKL